MVHFIRALVAVLLINGYAFSADECLQIDDGTTVVRVDRFQMSVSHHGKPMAGAEFELRQVRAIGNYLGISETKSAVLNKGITDRNGKLDLGGVAPGTYQLVMASPSHHEVTIQVLSPRPEPNSAVVALKLNYLCKDLSTSSVEVVY